MYKIMCLLLLSTPVLFGGNNEKKDNANEENWLKKAVTKGHQVNEGGYFIIASFLGSEERCGNDATYAARLFCWQAARSRSTKGNEGTVEGRKKLYLGCIKNTLRGVDECVRKNFEKNPSAYESWKINRFEISYVGKKFKIKVEGEDKTRGKCQAFIPGGPYKVTYYEDLIEKKDKDSVVMGKEKEEAEKKALVDELEGLTQKLEGLADELGGVKVTY